MKYYLILLLSFGLIQVEGQSTFTITGIGDSLVLVSVSDYEAGGETKTTLEEMDSIEMGEYLFQLATTSYRDVSRYQVVLDKKEREARRLRLLINNFQGNYYDLTYQSFSNFFFGDYVVRTSIDTDKKFFSLKPNQNNDGIRLREFTATYKDKIIDATTYSYDTTFYQSAAEELLQLGYKQGSNNRFRKRIVTKTNTSNAGVVLILSERSFLIRNYFLEDIMFYLDEQRKYVGYDLAGNKYVIAKKNF